MSNLNYGGITGADLRRLGAMQGLNARLSQGLSTALSIGGGHDYYGDEQARKQADENRRLALQNYFMEREQKQRDEAQKRAQALQDQQSAREWEGQKLAYQEAETSARARERDNAFADENAAKINYWREKDTKSDARHVADNVQGAVARKRSADMKRATDAANYAFKVQQADARQKAEAAKATASASSKSVLQGARDAARAATTEESERQRTLGRWADIRKMLTHPSTELDGTFGPSILDQKLGRSATEDEINAHTDSIFRSTFPGERTPSEFGDRKSASLPQKVAGIAKSAPSAITPVSAAQPLVQAPSPAAPVAPEPIVQAPPALATATPPPQPTPQEPTNIAASEVEDPDHLSARVAEVVKRTGPGLGVRTELEAKQAHLENENRLRREASSGMAGRFDAKTLDPAQIQAAKEKIAAKVQRGLMSYTDAKILLDRLAQREQEISGGK